MAALLIGRRRHDARYDRLECGDLILSFLHVRHVPQEFAPDGLVHCHAQGHLLEHFAHRELQGRTEKPS